MRLVTLGGGFTGAAVARLALVAGLEVVATTRSEGRAGSLRAIGVTPLVTGTLDPSALAAFIDPSARVLVTFSPDRVTDSAIVSTVSRARAVVYVSSTGVYGRASGRVDEETALDRHAPRAAERIDAETIWRGIGAGIVRAPAIYGPGRGLHLRLARGEARVAENARNVTSRVHVEDLAAALFTLLLREPGGVTYVAGDEAPTPHAEVIRWLCAAMSLPLPPHAALEDMDETLRSDRRVDAARIRAELGLKLVYPTYREGFAQCLRLDASAIEAALRERGSRD